MKNTSEAFRRDRSENAHHRRDKKPLMVETPLSGLAFSHHYVILFIYFPKWTISHKADTLGGSSRMCYASRRRDHSTLVAVKGSAGPLWDIPHSLRGQESSRGVTEVILHQTIWTPGSQTPQFISPATLYLSVIEPHSSTSQALTSLLRHQPHLFPLHPPPSVLRSVPVPVPVPVPSAC